MRNTWTNRRSLVEPLDTRVLLAARWISDAVEMTRTVVLDSLNQPLGYTTGVVPKGGVKVAPKSASVEPKSSSASTPVLMSGPENNTRFNITMIFSEGLTPSQQAIFSAAAAKWESVITADIPNVGAGPWGAAVDDVRIEAAGTDIDGPGGILGGASPQYKRSGSSLPINGVMEFDTADLGTLEASGQLTQVIVHEMAHVLGLGTIWTDRGLLTGAGSSNPIFTGANATAQYRLYANNATLTSVPVMNTGGVGTADSHWRDSIFNNELMTGFLNTGFNPLSRITAASMQDIGYPGVTYDSADAYNFNRSGIGANNTPLITALSASAANVSAGQTLTLTAAGVADTGGAVQQVRFFAESNGIPGLQFSGNVATFDTLIGSDTAGATYSLDYVIPVNAVPGLTTFYAQTVDTVGLASEFRTATTTITAGPPSAPSTPDLLAASDSGSSTDDITNDNTPAFVGTAVAGATVTIFADGVAVGSAPADGAGNYSFVTSLLSDGVRAITAVASNAGGSSSPSQALNVTIDTVGPTVSSGTFLFDTFQGIQLSFAENVGGVVASAQINSTNLDTSQTGFTLAFDTYAGNVATFRYTGGILPDGDYEASLVAASVQDVAGNGAVGSLLTSFFVLAGDWNRNREVDFADLLRVVQFYDLPSGQTWNTADFDYDGATTFSDLLIATQQYGKILT
jgi:trimeric autotransporter adhesin